jgi:hypothetical protein
MAATLGARNDALHRSHAEREVATFSFTAETSSLARSREIELQERGEAQRLRSQTEEAIRMASEAHFESEALRVASTSRLRETERLAEAELAAKSANLVMQAEHAVQREVAQHAREAKEEQRLLRDEVAAAESRARALLTTGEEKAEWARSRERSRDSDHSKVFEAMMEKMQLGMAALHQQATEERERMVRELRERDAAYMADSRSKQLAIDQLTGALSAALSRVSAESGRMAGSGGDPPPPPSGGGRAPDGDEGKPRERPKKRETLLIPAASSGTQPPTSRKTRMDPPPPPPDDDDDEDSDESEESEDPDEFEPVEGDPGRGGDGDDPRLPRRRRGDPDGGGGDDGGRGRRDRTPRSSSPLGIHPGARGRVNQGSGLSRTTGVPQLEVLASAGGCGCVRQAG